MLAESVDYWVSAVALQRRDALLLRLADGLPHTAGELAAQCGGNGGVVRQQMTTLARRGLVTIEQDARGFLRYRISNAGGQ